VRLRPEILEASYRAGAFPMADRCGRIEFYRSNPRSVLEFDSLHISKSLSRTLRKGVYDVRIDQNFEGIIRACARRPETWINEEIIRAFVSFHEKGNAHSVEAYRGDELAGGLYGVTLGGAFMGESMFSWMRDASKVCFVHLVERLKQRGYVLLDCQIHNGHLARLGAVEISDREYLKRLEGALRLQRTFV
jgi:leucyl/phenylalanyl-tRNA--protein transferase